MSSRFEALKNQFASSFYANERLILLKAMAQIGSFTELRHQLTYLSSRDEREILLEVMMRKANFKELEDMLLYTIYPAIRKKLLTKMTKLGNFEEINRQLKYIINRDEREILVKALASKAKKVNYVSNPDVKKTRRKSFVQVPKKSSKQFDVFIAHASEDKDFVAPLASSLIQRGLKVWYDDFVLKLGDSLRREIDRGLAQSHYGVVILSDKFFSKHWPQKELDGLAAKEQLDRKVILPVWHKIDKQEVSSYSPTLADIKAVKSTTGIENVTNEIIKAISF